MTTAAPSAAASPSPSNYANTTTSEEEEEGEHTLKGTIAMIMVGGAAVVCCLCCCLPSLCCQYAKEKKEVKILDQIIREHNQEVQHAIAGENPEAVAAFEKARKQWDRDAEKAAKGLKFLRLIRALLQIPKCILGLAGRVLLQLFQIVILMYSLAEWKGTNPFADIDQALAYVSKALEMISGPLGAPLGIISYWIRYVLSYLDISGLLKQYTDGRCTGLADAVALTLLLYSIQNILPWLTRKDFLLRANQEAIRLAAVLS